VAESAHRLDDYAAESPGLEEDPFADLVVEALDVHIKQGRRRTKHREAGDGKGPVSKPCKQQTCSVCSKPRHNRLRCQRLQILKGDAIGLGVI
jgi:hypothetical protein